MSQRLSSGPSDGKAPTIPLHKPVGAAEFKARCLQIMDLVNETGAEVTITKHGHPVAKLVPVSAQLTRPPILGSCKGSLYILTEDDLVPSTEDEWNGREAKTDRGSDGALRT